MELADGTLLQLFQDKILNVLPSFRDDIDVRRDTVLETAENIRKQIQCLRPINKKIYLY